MEFLRPTSLSEACQLKAEHPALPVMILYFLAQRFMVQGLAAGAIKG